MRELVILAHVPTDSVSEGFIPAARRLGLKVILMTDSADAYRQQYSPDRLEAYPDEIIACDVFNPLSVIGNLTCRARPPAAIFSNSDHLQASTAIAARYFGLPGKDWEVAYRAKNKAEMRAALHRLGLDTLWNRVVRSEADIALIGDTVPFPCIVKPREGVASQQVTLSHGSAELAAQCRAVWMTQPGLPLLLEQYIEGPLYTMETLGDGNDLRVLGGFQVILSPPPYFVELEARWGLGLTAREQAQVVAMIRAFGVGFGACHTEFVMTAQGPRLIEINYRSIGDYREFLLQDTLGIPLFEIVLRMHLGERLPQLDVAPNAALIRYFTAPSAGRLLAMPDGFVHHRESLRLTYKPLRTAGEQIHLTNSNKDYLGVLRGIGTDARHLQTEMDRVANTLAWEIAA